MTNETGRYIFLSQEDFDDYINDTNINITPETRQILYERYFISDESHEVFIRSAEHAVRSSKSYLFVPASLFILAITNSCNARCVYCQARGGSEIQNMSIETSRKALERISESPAKNFTIEFQGGEPLSNFEVIRHTVNYAQELMPDIKLILS